MTTQRKDELAISDAAILGNVEEMRRLLTIHPDLANSYSGRRPLLQHAVRGAVRHGKMELVELLVNAGCNVNAECEYAERTTGLDEAIGLDSVPITKFLLEHGANPNQGRQIIAAIVGSHQHSLDLVKLLDKHGVDLHRVFENELTKKPMSALSAAVDWRKNEVAEYLRTKGAVLPSAGNLQPEPKTLSDDIVNYFEEHFGPVQKSALIEIVPTDPPIAVHVVPSSSERHHITLFTTGMSYQPMIVAEGGKEYEFAELFIELPANWKYTEISEQTQGWPIHWLRSTAKYPHQHRTWLGGPVTLIAHGDPPPPLAPNTEFSSMLLLAEKQLVATDGRTVQLYRMTPLYTEERALEIRQGIGALLRAFDRNNVSFIVDLNRVNVGKL